MALGLVGKKCGMTRVFQEDGTSVPVSVIEIVDNKIVSLKTPETDGYSAVQVTYGENTKAHKLSKPMVGHYNKAGITPGLGLCEFRVDELSSFAVGNEIKVDLFTDGQLVDVCGISRGKGFAGTIKRHNFTMGDATHGNSLSHRAPGSIGQRQSPGRVFKGKKMAGRMGGKQVTTQNLEVVRLMADKNVVLVKGAIPGAPGSWVVITPAVKAAEKSKV